MKSAETRLDQLAPAALGVASEVESAATILEEAMARSHAACGAVVSMVGGSVRIVAASPNGGWVRSVDLYIARALLMRPAASGAPPLAASDRAYIALAAPRQLAVLILSDS